MNDGIPLRTQISGTGTVTIRQRPSLLLMKVTLHTAEPTLELGLTKLKKQCESASQWMKRLHAIRVEFGEPHFADQADKDPMKRIQAATVRVLRQQPPAKSSPDRKRDIQVIMTAIWDITSLSAEETLILVDRLQFEADDPEITEIAEESWKTPEEQTLEIMASIANSTEDERKAQFLFISRLDEAQLDKALTEAFSLAQQNAERFARSMGRRIQHLSLITFRFGDLEVGRADKLMNRQRSWALLAGCSYDPKENEVVSENPQSAEFIIKSDVHGYLE
jgi:hypothetical protein